MCEKIVKSAKHRPTRYGADVSKETSIRWGAAVGFEQGGASWNLKCGGDEKPHFAFEDLILGMCLDDVLLQRNLSF